MREIDARSFLLGLRAVALVGDLRQAADAR